MIFHERRAMVRGKDGSDQRCSFGFATPLSDGEEIWRLEKRRWRWRIRMVKIWSLPGRLEAGSSLNDSLPSGIAACYNVTALPTVNQISINLTACRRSITGYREFR